MSFATPSSLGCFPEVYNVQSQGICLGPSVSGSLWQVSALEVPALGDIVAVWLVPGRCSDGTEGNEIGHRVARGEACLVKILLEQDAESVTIMTLDPVEAATIPRNNIVALHRMIAVRLPTGREYRLRPRAA